MNDLEIRRTLLLLTVMSAVSAQPGHEVEHSSQSFANPVIAGDWSDPGVIRAGGEYYSVRSTFGWQPGLQIMRSRDLVHWDYAGFGLLSQPAVRPGTTSGGVWGSDIAYNPNTRQFVLYAPIENRIHAMFSSAPGGPYSEPVDLGLKGIDPGFFADEDRRIYLVWDWGKIVELTADGLAVKREVCEVGAGRGRDFEGPDIFKRRGWYYCVYSTGGTRPHQGSTISTLRARDLHGPWIPDPSNPQMEAGDTTGAQFQGPAHGTLIETQHGEWYLSYHAYELTHYSLGRQMLLAPVEWTADGWWRPVEGRIPSRMPRRPRLIDAPCRPAESDEFDAPQLGLQWFFHGGASSWSLSDPPGRLRIRLKQGDIGAMSNVFLQRVTRKRFEFSTRLEFEPDGDGQAAGIQMYHDPGMNFWLTSTRRAGTAVFEAGKYDAGRRSILAWLPNRWRHVSYLKIAVDGEERASFYISGDGRNWQRLDASVYFGDSWQDLRDGEGGAPDLGWVGVNKRNVWTGAAFGLFAAGGDAPDGRAAMFDWFRVD